jgi:hypothetical protein
MQMRRGMFLHDKAMSRCGGMAIAAGFRGFFKIPFPPVFHQRHIMWQNAAATLLDSRKLR